MMKMLHTTVMIRLLVLLILAVHTAPAVRIRTYSKRIIGKRRRVSPGSQISMTLYDNSIDDDFAGCREEMYERVTQLLDTELNSNEDFNIAWYRAKDAFRLIDIRNSDLTEEQLRKVALRAYTDRIIFAELNEKMREGRDNYNNFGLKSLHFLMTDGIQTLNANRTCQTTYRRTNVAIEITDTFVRFGSFASSSFKANLKFGTETCFKITTCHGADIAALSKLRHEAEVLIPPYEVFIKEPDTDIPELKDCNRVHRLRSVGTISAMKCELVQTKTSALPELLEVLTYDLRFN